MGDRKPYSYDHLERFVGCDVEYTTTSNEHYIGRLASYNPATGRYVFRMVRDLNGKVWSLSQNYVASEFTCVFLAKELPPEKPAENTRQVLAEQKIKDDLQDKAPESAKVDQTDLITIFDDTNPEVSETPYETKDVIYEVWDYDFSPDLDEFETCVSTDVSRITSTEDSDFKQIINIINTRELLSVTVLPDSKNNRTEPIEFIIFGCDQGSYCFTADSKIMSHLKPVLESDEICKVMHDSCVPVARIHFLFNIEINNIDDTLILDSVQGSSVIKGYKCNRQTRRYAQVVSDYLNIDIPWDTFYNYYTRSGKGLLLAEKLNDTGRAYIRSLAILLPELRSKIFKQIHKPILAKNFIYSNCLKHCCHKEHDFQVSGCLVDPSCLSNSDRGNPQALDLLKAEVATMFKKKHKYFNRVKKRMTSDACTQTVNMESPMPTPNSTPGQLDASTYADHHHPWCWFD